MPSRPGAGRASQAITAKVLAIYGDACHLCGRPGATSRDHLIPYSLGGTDELTNLRPAHRRCNSKRGNRALNGYGAHITIVIGPPGAGKTTWVNEQATLKDIVIDLDVIARALMPQKLDARTHVYPQHVRHVAIGARKAAIERATRLVNGARVFIIHALPSAEQMDEYRFLRYEIVTIDPGRAVVEKRVAAERPSYMMSGVSKWYATWGAKATPPSSSRDLVAVVAESDGDDW